MTLTVEPRRPFAEIEPPAAVWMTPGPGARSESAGFQSLSEVVEVMGPPELDARPSWVMYPGQVVFSRFQWV